MKALLEGGASGPAIEPGRSDESPLLDLIAENGDSRMPPPGDGEALEAQQAAWQVGHRSPLFVVR